MSAIFLREKKKLRQDGQNFKNKKHYELKPFINYNVFSFKGGLDTRTKLMKLARENLLTELS